MDALVADQLAEVEDGRARRVGEERGKPGGVALVGEALLGVAGIGVVGSGLAHEGGERDCARDGLELVDVDPGRHLVHALRVRERPADLRQHRADVRRADEDATRVAQALPAPLRQLGMVAHRVLELGAVRLHRERRRRARDGSGTDRPAQQHVVREDEVGGQQLAQRRRARRDEAVGCGALELVQAPRLEALVAVEHEDGQDRADVRPDDLRPAQVVELRVPLLADHRDVVAGQRPLACQSPRVDVRAGATQEVAVPEQDAHRAAPPGPDYVRWK